MVSTVPLVGLTKPVQKPLREVGGFVALALDTFVQALRLPFYWLGQHMQHIEQLLASPGAQRSGFAIWATRGTALLGVGSTQLGVGRTAIPRSPTASI